jgi:DNA (cytosine-5)-methyltransferase 1
VRPVSYGSVCSGIEAATAAWEEFGWEAKWFAEIEAAPSSVLRHHYPKVPNLGDMTKLAAMVRLGLIPAPDVLVGGTPCQAFSVAGLRGGMADLRGQLTLSFVDLANAIDEQRPDDECVIYWENVPGVLSDKKNAFGCYLAALAGSDDELIPEPRPAAGKNSAHWRWSKKSGNHSLSWPNVGCVYGPRRTISWRVFDAQYFGVAQRRRRVFLVASSRAGFNPEKLLFEFDGVRRDSPPRRETGQSSTHETAPCLTSSGRGVARTGDTRGQDPVVAVCPTLRAGGNETGGDRPPGTDVDTCDSLILVMAHGQAGADVSVGLRSTLTCNHEAPIAFYSEAHQDLMPTMLNGANGPAGHNARSGHTKDSYIVPVCVTGTVTHTLRADGFDASEDGTGRGTPIVVHGTQDPCVSEHLAFALGRNNGGENAVLSVASSGGDKARVLAPLSEASRLVAGCLTSNYGKQLDNSDTSLGPNVAINGMRVRRLMPIECERL